jgi:hypothetical protein
VETRFDKIQRALFTDPRDNKVVLSAKDQEIKLRYEKTFTYWVSNPHLTDRQVVRFLINQGVSQSVAYEDLRRIRLMLGNVQMASKEWYRHMVIEMCRKAYSKAEAQGDAKAMALAASTLGKYTKLDKDEAESLPWDQLVPPNFEPEPDPTILGLPADPNIEKNREALRRKYLRTMHPDFVEDAEVVEES